MGWRIAGYGAATIGTVATFALATVGSVFLHTGLPAGRRVAAEVVTEVLAPMFQGRIVVEGINRLSLLNTGVDGLRAKVYAPDGDEVAAIAGGHARVSLYKLLASLVDSKKPIDVDIKELSIDDANVKLTAMTDGTLTLQHAFDPKTVTPPSTTPGKGVLLEFPKVHLEHAWAHGAMGGQLIDVELAKVDASARVAPDDVEANLTRLHATARAIVPEPILADIDGHFEMPLTPTPVQATVEHPLPGAPPAAVAATVINANGHVNASAGDAKVAIVGSIKGGQDIAATVDIPETQPAAIRALVPDAPVYQPVSAHIDAKGTLANLEATGHVGVGAKGTVDLTASANLADTVAKTIHATVDAKRVDISAFAPGTKSDLNTKVTVAAKIAANNTVSGTYSVVNAPGEVSGQAIPAAEIGGSFTQNHVDGHATVHEAGAPTELTFALDPSTPKATTPSIVKFDTTTDVADLNAVKRIGAIGRGQVKVRTTGQMDITAKTIEARAVADVHALDIGSAHVDHLNLTAHASGPIANLALDARVRAETIDAGGFDFDHLTAEVTGSTQAGHVKAEILGAEDMPSAKVDADFALGKAIDISNITLDGSRQDVKLQAKVAHVRSGGGALDVEGAHVEGLGKPLDAEAHLRGGNIAIKAHSDDLDVTKLATLAGQGHEVKKGHLGLDVDMTVSKREAKGYAALALKDAVVWDYPAVDAAVRTTFEGQQMETRVSAKMNGVASLDMQTSDVTLAGGPLDPAAWMHAVGKVDVESNVDIERSFEIIQPDVPIGEASGTVHMFASAARARPDAAPDMAIGIVTKDLVVAGARPVVAAPPPPVKTTASDKSSATGTASAAAPRPSGTATAATATPGASSTTSTAATAQATASHTPVAATSLAPPPWETRGLDLHFEGLVDGDENTVALRTELTDAQGAFVHFAAETKLPIADLMADPSKIASLAKTAPLNAHLDIQRRKTGKLPMIVPKLPVAGELAASVDVQGTALNPKAVVEVDAFNLHPQGDKKESMDAKIVVSNDEHGVTLVADGQHDKKQVLHADAAVHLNGTMANAIASSDPMSLPWDAEAHVKLDDFPMSMVPSGSSDSNFTGSIKGSVDLTGLHKDANLKVALDTTAIALGKQKIVDHGQVVAEVSGGQVKADARLTQANGFVEAKANGGLVWGAALAPSMDKSTALDTSLDAKTFDLVGIAPFIDGAVNDLSGTLDANAKVHLTPDPSGVQMSGEVDVKNAGMEIPAMGEELHNLQAKLTMKSDGSITLEDLEADPATGHVKVTGGAKMAGMNFESATAHVAIANGHEIPIAAQGVQYGDAWGNIDATVKSSAGKLDVDVSIPTFHMHLPQSTGHSVQALDADPDITIGRRTATGRMKLIALAAPAAPAAPSDTATHVAVHLGKDVYIKRDTTLLVDVTGDPVMDMQGGQTVMSGQLRLTGGKLEVNGKGFEIDSGTVTFSGDPANPVVVVEAHWDAPDADKTRVTAEFVGPVKTGKVTLRSEPSLTENEILSLILFGSADSSLGSSDDANSPGTTTAGAAAAGGVASQAVNKALSGVTGDAITTRVDTSEADNPRPDIGWQISKSVQAHILVNLGLPAPGDNPDDEMLQVDWRFIRSWTLTGTVGDAGSSLLDLGWRYRY